MGCCTWSSLLSEEVCKGDHLRFMDFYVLGKNHRASGASSDSYEDEYRIHVLEWCFLSVVHVFKRLIAWDLYAREERCRSHAVSDSFR